MKTSSIKINMGASLSLADCLLHITDIELNKCAKRRYSNNVVKLVAYGEVLRSFRNVNYFFFWTGFNGTRTFRRSAPTDVHIYGGGKNLYD